MGLAVHTVTGDLWCSTNERDGLGDDLVQHWARRRRRDVPRHRAQRRGRAERLVDQVHGADDLAERQIGQALDQAELDREPDELARRLDHALFVAQPDQRLDADDLLGADVDLGLERAAETAVAEGEPQPLLPAHARRHGAPHVGIEQPAVGRYLAATGFRFSYRADGVSVYRPAARAMGTSSPAGPP